MTCMQSGLLKTGAALVFGAMLLAGCADKTSEWFDAQFSENVEQARKLPPKGSMAQTPLSTVMAEPSKGTSFTENLSTDYKALMLFEADEMYDDVSAEMYAQRALATAKGDPVGPVELSKFDLPTDVLPVLTQSRSEMEALFAKGATTKFPALSVRVQTSFDCWVEQQEENHQPDDIAACRDKYVDAYQQLAKAMEPAAPMKRSAAAAPMPSFKESYTVYFALNSDKLSPAADNKLGEVIEALKKQNANASIIGYTDTLGGPTYNMTLSERRAKAVADKLMSSGIRPAVLTTEGRGKTDLAVPTADNVGEPRNRRAVINIR